VLVAAGLLLLVLLATSGEYGYHRDELYFRLLPPALGYTDQPPLTPLLVHGISQLVDQVWAIRLPAALAAAGSVVVVAAITAEAGGAVRAQLLAAWGYGFADFTLQLGHVLLTASLDLLVWPLVVLLALRAVLRDDGRWWLVAGLVAGLSLYNKLLIAVLLAALAAGLLATAPLSWRTWRWPLAGFAITIAVGSPNLIYQVLNGFPQLAMGATLSTDNGAALRPWVIPFLSVLLGPTLTPFWIAGLARIVRRPEWRQLRLLAVTFVVSVLLVLVIGSQFYYCYGVLAAVYAVGCIPVAEWASTQSRTRTVTAAILVNTAASAIVSLPVVPLPLLGMTPVPAWDKVARDQVGWPRYAAEVSVVPETAGSDSIVLTSNYGEAGAIERFAPALADRVYSGHNAMHTLAAPPASTNTVVTVGYGMGWAARYFDRCTVTGRLDSGLDVHSEEQGAPITVCTGRTAPMREIWAAAGHLG
jgi:hypothetical protein